MVQGIAHPKMAYLVRRFTQKKLVDPKSLSRTELSRCLSIFDLTALGIGSTLGAGIYVLAGEVARSIAGPSIVISFFIAAVASILSGLCYAEFGARVPKAGSAYVYSYVTVGELCAFVIGWNLFLEYVIGASSVARAWSEYFDSVLNSRIRNYTLTNIGEMHASGLSRYPDFFAFFLVLLVTFILGIGVKNSSRFNNIFTGINLLVILFITCVGLYFAKGENWTRDFAPFGISGIFSGAATCFYAFVGFDVIATTGEEARNPSRAIPISIVLALGICFVAYFGVSAVLTLMWPYYKLSERSALPEVFAMRGAEWAKYIIAVGALCGLSASLIGALFPLPRMLYAMASDGLIFKFLAKVHPRTEIPVIATVLSGALAAFLALIFDLQALVEMMSIGTLLAYTIVALCVLLLRYQPGSIGIVKGEENIFSGNDGNVEEEAAMEHTRLTAQNNGPTLQTARLAAIAIYCNVTIYFFISILLIWGGEAILKGRAWAIFMACLLGIFLVTFIVLLVRQPQNKTPLPFKVPCVPAIPLLSIFVNIFLIMKLNYLTWLRFAVWMAIALGVGCTLGAGVYVIACEIARDVAGPATVISFLIAGIASVLSGLCYAEFGARVPKAGSAYIYSYVTVGELVAFIIGWNLVMEYMIGAAAIGRAWSAYFDSMIHDKIRGWTLANIGSIRIDGLGGYPDFLAVGIILILMIIQLFGVKKSTAFIFGVTCVNMVVIVFIIIMGITLARPEYWSDFMPYGPTGVLAGSATAFFAFVGFDVIATAGEEAKNPSRTIPLSILFALSICFLAYFGVSAAVTLIWPYDKLDYGAALPKAFEHRGANFAKYIIAVGALCGMTAAINGGLFPLPRLLYAMASDGLIFKSFSYVSKRTEVPYIGTLFSGILAGILAMVFELQALVEMMSIGTLQAYTIVSTSVLILRYQPGTIGLVKSHEEDPNSSPQSKDPNLSPQSKDPVPEPTARSGTISKCTIWFLFFYFFLLSAFLINGLIPMYQCQAWAVILGAFLVIIFAAAIVVLCMQPKSLTPLPFKVPLVPGLPLCSMFINIYLMMELNPATWMRFAVWMAIGLSIYIFYGLRHSVEGQRQTEQEGYLPLEQLEGKGDQQKGIETPEPNN